MNGAILKVIGELVPEVLPILSKIKPRSRDEEIIALLVATQVKQTREFFEEQKKANALIHQKLDYIRGVVEK